MNWTERNEAWEGRARALGERAVLHVGHKTVEQQIAIFQKQEEAILPIFRQAVQAMLPYPPLLGKPSWLLDFGCGVGRWTHILSKITGAETLGIDPTRTFIDYCRTHHPNPTGVPFVDFELYENGQINLKDETVDIVWACMVLSTILDVSGGMFEHTVNELRRVLRPGGLMFLVDNTSGPPHRPIVRSPYSISRTIPEYEAAFSWCDLRAVGGYEDLGEINTVFHGRKR